VFLGLPNEGGLVSGEIVENDVDLPMGEHWPMTLCAKLMKP